MPCCASECWVLSPETCRVKPLRRINAIVASCWIYFTINTTIFEWSVVTVGEWIQSYALAHILIHPPVVQRSIRKCYEYSNKDCLVMSRVLCLNMSDNWQSVKNVFVFHGSVHRKRIFKYNQQDAALHKLFLWNALHVSGGSSAHHQELKNCIYSIGYFVKPFMVPATVVEEMELRQKRSDKVPDGVYTVFELLMMGGGTAWNM